MRGILLSMLAVGTALAASTPAEAAEGCGRAFHRDFYGRCVPDARVVVVPRAGLYYPGQGYWYAGRYWPYRYHWRGGWRYAWHRPLWHHPRW